MFIKYSTLGCVILFLAAQTLTAQDITFDKSYSWLGSGIRGYSVFESNDNGFLIGAVSNLKLTAVKTDQYGNITWSRDIATNNSITVRSYPLSKTSDGGVVLIGTINSIARDFLLTKLTQNGEIEWSFMYGDENQEYGTAVIQSDDGNYFAAGGNRVFTFTKAKLLKVNAAGSLIWMKEYEITNSANQGYILLKLPDGNLLLCGGNDLLKLDTDGNIIWSRTSSFAVTAACVSIDDKITITGSGKFEKIDLEGNSIFSADIPFNPTSIALSSDGGFIVTASGSSNFIKINSSAEIEWQKELRGITSAACQASGGGFAVTGMLESRLWLVKTDNNGFYKALDLISPAAGAKLLIFNSHEISWYSLNITEIDIDYSTDGGVNWKNITSNYSAESHAYLWTVPNEPSSNCIIKIYESAHPNLTSSSGGIKIVLEQNYDYISVNEVKMWIGNHGEGSHNLLTDGHGFLWPGGEEAVKNAIYQDGLLFGGKVNGELRVNGNTHRAGLQPGIILPDGTPADPDEPKYKIYKIRKGWESMPSGGQRDRYEYDFNNWPVESGAPWIDANNDGVFTRGVDQPHFIGDEVLFYTANDLDSSAAHLTFETYPVGLEFQTTVFGFNRDDILKNVVFKKYRFINKSSSLVENMYLGYWTDNDLGAANDDFNGCDTTLSLGYTYNSKATDDIYGTNPPAVGHMLLYGPIVEGSLNDTAWFGGERRSGYKNLQVTAFSHYLCYPSGVYLCPSYDYQGALQLYDNMQGYGLGGVPYIDPNTMQATPYCIPGDPVSGSGWYEGPGWPGGFPAGDRYYLVSTGPFNLAPGDTQEVLLAILIAQGSNNLTSVTELKITAANVQKFFESGFDENYIVSSVSEQDDLTELKFQLYQNYPNPFNPTTKIKYTVASEVRGQTSNDKSRKPTVVLKVFDILGREVAVLINEEKSPGTYEVEFSVGASGNTTNLASGVYCYRLIIGDFVQTKKMILLR